MSGKNTPKQSPIQSEQSAPSNPHLRRIERAPYELAYLLKSMRPDFSSYEKASRDDVQLAAAAAEHAENANSTILFGMQALGRLLYVAASNEEIDIDRNSLANIGNLISHLAMEAQFTGELEHDLKFTVNEQKKRFGIE